MGNGRSGLLEPSDRRDNGRKAENTRGDAAMLIDDHASNRGKADSCASTERNLQYSERSAPGDSNTACNHNSGSDKEGHVWQEIASMYKQIVERDNGLLPPSTPRSTILMYHSPVALNAERLDETNCVNTDNSRSSGANAKYVDSSTSTAEDQQLPNKYYITHGVNTTTEDHASTRDVEMFDGEIGNDCPRILESFSLSESHSRFLPGQQIQQQDEDNEGARLKMGNAHGFVYPAQVEGAWDGVMTTETDTINSKMDQSQHERPVFKVDPSETMSCCCGEPQTIDTRDFNQERTPFQIKGTAWKERDTTGVGHDVCQMVQGHCPQPEHSNQTKPAENITSCGTRVGGSRASVSEMNHCSEAEEFRASAAGSFSVKEEPMAEEEPASFTDKNMMFGINCERNGSEITLMYGATEDKGTQYLVEDTGLCPVSASKPSVSSSVWMQNVGVTKECGIYKRSDHGGNLPLSNLYPSSHLSASKHYSVARAIQENTGLRTNEEGGKNVPGISTHIISTHVQAKSGFAVDYALNTASEKYALPILTVDSSTAKRQPENSVPRESKISQLKRLLEQQEEELEKVRSQRKWETDDQEQLMDYAKEDLEDDTFVSNKPVSNNHETKVKKSSCPGQKIRNKVTDRRETLSQVIRAEMAKQNQARKGKRKGECLAYMDSTGVIVFGRKLTKKKSAVSSNRLENLIFRLRNSLGKENGVSKSKSRSKFLAKRHKTAAPSEALKRTKEASTQDSRIAKQIPISTTNASHLGRKNKTSEAAEASKPSKNETKREHQPSCSVRGNMGRNAAFKDDHMLKNDQDEFLATFGITRKTLDFVTGKFSARYGGPRRRFLDHEIQPTDCRELCLGADFEYRDEQGWFII